MDPRTAHALLVAFELLRNQIQDNTVALAANARSTEAQLNDRSGAVGAFLGGKGGFGAGAGAGGPPVIVPPGAGGTPAPSTVSRTVAGDRPQAVVIMGPNPLPVTVVGGMPGGAAAPARRAAPPEKPGSSPLGSVFGMLAGKFLAIAGPFALLGTVLSSTTSGLHTLGTAFKLVGSALAPIILPGALMLATAMTAIAEVISDGTGPAMDNFFDFMFNTFIPVIETLVDKFMLLIDAVNWASEAFKAVGEKSSFLMGMLTGGAGASEESQKKTGDAMHDVMESFRRSIGPKAQISGLAEVGKQVQLAALSADPLEARLMRQQLAVLERIEMAIKRREEGDAGRVHDPAPAATVRSHALWRAALAPWLGIV